MERTVRDALLTALDDLSGDSFKRFCNKIMDWNIEPNFSKIPKSKLEKKERDDAVDVILSFYMASYGAELAVDVLNAINEKQVALNLEKDLENVKDFVWRKKPEEPQPTSEASGSSTPEPKEVPIVDRNANSQASGSSTSEPKKATFVDNHREQLIARYSHLPPVLDSLFSSKLLTQEQYDNILAEKTPQDRMRKLYMYIRGWSNKDKQELYEILKNHNPPLIQNLEEP